MSSRPLCNNRLITVATTNGWNTPVRSMHPTFQDPGLSGSASGPPIISGNCSSQFLPAGMDWILFLMPTNSVKVQKTNRQNRKTKYKLLLNLPAKPDETLYADIWSEARVLSQCAHDLRVLSHASIQTCSDTTTSDIQIQQMQRDELINHPNIMQQF